jgi:hypothetical protein
MEMIIVCSWMDWGIPRYPPFKAARFVFEIWTRKLPNKWQWSLLCGDVRYTTCTRVTRPSVKGGGVSPTSLASPQTANYVRRLWQLQATRSAVARNVNSWTATSNKWLVVQKPNWTWCRAYVMLHIRSQIPQHRSLFENLGLIKNHFIYTTLNKKFCAEPKVSFPATRTSRVNSIITAPSYFVKNSLFDLLMIQIYTRPG